MMPPILFFCRLLDQHAKEGQDWESKFHDLEREYHDQEEELKVCAPI